MTIPYLTYSLYILRSNADNAAIFVVVSIVIIFVIIGLIYDYTESARDTNEFNEWRSSSAGAAILKIPDEFAELVKGMRESYWGCSKCGSRLYKFWDLQEDKLILRCENCKKKHPIDITENVNELITNYISFVSTAFNPNNKKRGEVFRSKLVYSFNTLRKNEPFLRAIQFFAEGEKPEEAEEDYKSKKSRRIPQSVMDKVWRRDEGKCVQCGSNESLEFDHIIPHSKGGANTYRNIQLLCEKCNRVKSDKIG